ncbi:MAG: Holliday junction DNA helicase RuvA [Candidatus Reconcilbacillus cellulovorans]|uniref:Holliday junction branch migration complex subunit RuvA n=1 Tax=Candidatus Reconcilbacillus cellulovorans TaxID=1906605 RepID=A0A2A6E096_9BACL|nr:MAG: Holliday junction DNA helicase RuvA [Candidatus Reconcilbacillus cellulovorans]
MMEYLRGKAVYVGRDCLVVDVGGIGYRIVCPDPRAFRPAAGGETVVYVHQVVREDAVLLYGFPTREEQQLFRLLLHVSGVGPKVALGVLTGGSPDSVIRAVLQENLDFLSKLPGVGKKTAQRIILELKEKILKRETYFDLLDAAVLQAEDSSRDGLPASAGVGGWDEAREALVALGYTSAEAERVYRRIKDTVDPAAPVDVWVRSALRALDER